MNENAPPVVLSLSQDEALVFFEWLMKVDKEAETTDAALDDPELIVRWRLEGQLESRLVQLFQSDYGQAVQRAGKRIVESAIAPDSRPEE